MSNEFAERSLRELFSGDGQDNKYVRMEVEYRIAKAQIEATIWMKMSVAIIAVSTALNVIVALCA